MISEKEAKNTRDRSIFWTIFGAIGIISFFSYLIFCVAPYSVKHSKQNIKYHNKKEIISELQLIKEKINTNNFIPLTEKEKHLLKIKKDILNIIEKVEKEN